MQEAYVASVYSSFLRIDQPALQAITYCTGAMEQKKIAAAFVGHFVSLGAHVIGARTVESILQIYAPKFTRGLKAEFYGSVSDFGIVVYGLNYRCT